MANGLMQLKGSFKCAAAGDTLVDYSGFVSRAGITEQRAVVTLKPVLSTAESSSAAGEMTRELVLEFRSTTAASALRGVIKEIINNDDALMDFEYIENDDVVSSDNPRYSGTALVPQLEGTPNVGALREQTITCPIVTWNEPDITP